MKAKTVFETSNIYFLNFGAGSAWPVFRIFISKIFILLLYIVKSCRQWISFGRSALTFSSLPTYLLKELLQTCRPLGYQCSVLDVRYYIEFSIQQSLCYLTESRIQIVDEVRDYGFCNGEPSGSSVMYSVSDVYSKSCYSDRTGHLDRSLNCVRSGTQTHLSLQVSQERQNELCRVPVCQS